MRHEGFEGLDDNIGNMYMYTNSINIYIYICVCVCTYDIFILFGACVVTMESVGFSNEYHVPKFVLELRRN